MRKVLIIFILLAITTSGNAQNWAKIYLGGKYSEGEWVSSFQLDLNRSEAKKEDANDGSFPIGTGNSSVYFKPSASINIGGDSAKVASDDLLFQAEFLFLLRRLTKISDVKSKGGFSSKTSRFVRVELNPSYNADKHINERIVFIQPKIMNYYFIYEKYPTLNTSKKMINIVSYGSSIYSNVGARNSRDFQSSKFYATAGASGDFSWSLKKWKEGKQRNLIDVKIASSGVYIISEAAHFSSVKPLRFNFKSSVDFHIADKLSIGLEYKSGDISPDYSRYESYGVTLKVKK